MAKQGRPRQTDIGETDTRIRLNFLMVPQLVDKVDAYAKELGITRGYAFAVIVSNYFKYMDAQQITMESLAYMKSEDGKQALRSVAELRSSDEKK